MSGSHLSKQFFELVKAIGESKSKQEEDRIIVKEVEVLKEKFSKKAKPAETKEYLVRLMYCEMLGHDGSFGYIHAVQLSAREHLSHKKTAYLACAQMLRPDHELRFMMVNQMQRDLHPPFPSLESFSYTFDMPFTDILNSLCYKSPCRNFPDSIALNK